MQLPAGAFDQGDPDVLAHWARMTSADTDQKNDIANLILGLKDDGVWDLVEMLCVVHDNEADSLLDITGNDNDSFKYGSPSFTADRGFTTSTGNLPGSSIDGWTGVFLEDDNSFYYYRRTAVTTGGSRMIAGAHNYNSWSDGSYMFYNIYPGGDEFNLYLEGLNISYSVSTLAGFSAASRTSSSDVRIFKDGSSSPYTNSSSYGYPEPVDMGAEIGIATFPLWIGGNIAYYGTVLESAQAAEADQYSAWGCGGGMSHAELNYLYNRVTTYLTARGAI